ncbi:hypothetical protein FWF48_04250 [Candidatus Saccharibacteria bacterium]|nr:hypothetical protein [Candidatus Saccharibacteria bacterium]
MAKSNARARTYARNRTNLSRRGFEKFTEPDGIFLLKLVGVVILGSFWLKFGSPLKIGTGYLFGIPAGLLIGLVLIRLVEKRSENRKIWFAVILIVAILTYFIPAGIVL